MLGTFEKAGRVLDLFTPQRPEWGVTEIARVLDMPPSSAHLLLRSLTELGLLHRTAAGRYRLGFRLLALARTLLANTPWRDIARREMEALHARLGETLHLTALDGGALIRVDALPGSLPASVPTQPPGAALPLHASASGKVLAAYRPDEVRFPARPQALTPATVTDPEELASELRGVLARGLAYSIGEFQAGVCSVAAPVRNHNAEVIAALSVNLPEHRYPARKAEVAAALAASAGRISAAIGYDAGQPGTHWASVAGRDEPRPRRQARRGKG